MARTKPPSPASRCPTSPPVPASRIVRRPSSASWNRRSRLTTATGAGVTVMPTPVACATAASSTVDTIRAEARKDDRPRQRMARIGIQFAHRVLPDSSACVTLPPEPASARWGSARPLRTGTADRQGSPCASCSAAARNASREGLGESSHVRHRPQHGVGREQAPGPSRRARAGGTRAAPCAAARARCRRCRGTRRRILHRVDMDKRDVDQRRQRHAVAHHQAAVGQREDRRARREPGEAARRARAPPAHGISTTEASASADEARGAVVERGREMPGADRQEVEARSGARGTHRARDGASPACRATGSVSPAGRSAAESSRGMSVNSLIAQTSPSR